MNKFHIITIDNVYIIPYHVYMIQITAYVRNEQDLALWKRLKNKTQFIHDCLQSTDLSDIADLNMEVTPIDGSTVMPVGNASITLVKVEPKKQVNKRTPLYGVAIDSSIEPEYKEPDTYA